MVDVIKNVEDIIERIKRGEYDSEKFNSLGIQLLNKNPQIAEKIFYNLLEKEGEKDRGRNLNNLGLAFLFQGKVEEAEKRFQEAYQWDIKQVGEEKARKLPAFNNLNFFKSHEPLLFLPLELEQTNITESMKKLGVRLTEEKGEGKLEELKKIIRGDILGGGIIAGCLLILFQLFLSNFNFYLQILFIFGLLIASIIALIKYK